MNIKWMQNAHQRFIIECMKLVRAYICGCCVNTAPDALITAAADGAGEGIVSWTSVGTVLTLQICPGGREGDVNGEENLKVALVGI